MKETGKRAEIKIPGFIALGCPHLNGGVNFAPVEEHSKRIGGGNVGARRAQEEFLEIRRGAVELLPEPISSAPLWQARGDICGAATGSEFRGPRPAKTNH